jgi:hypothetical protein
MRAQTQPPEQKRLLYGTLTFVTLLLDWAIGRLVFGVFRGALATFSVVACL